MVNDVFQAAQLTAHGPLPWGQALPDTGAGVYVVVADNDEHEVVYIGRTGRSLRRRLREFCRHRYGDKRPHRGGQEVLLLKCPLLVYWAPTADYAAAENSMIEYFKTRTGGLPYANRMRAARVLQLVGGALQR